MKMSLNGVKPQSGQQGEEWGPGRSPQILRAVVVLSCLRISESLNTTLQQSRVSHYFHEKALEYMDAGHFLALPLLAGK